MKKDNKRHIYKTLTWRFLATTITISVAWLLTGNIKFGLGIGLVELIIKTFAYYFHERLWFKYIRFDKKPKNIYKQQFDTNTQQGKGFVIWLTGLSGSGKSAIADQLSKELITNGYKTYILDGDNVRWGLNSDLSFSSKDREENIRRVAEVSKLFTESGIIVITSFISPYEKTRQMARNIIGHNDYVEVFVNTELDTCIRRDVKGLYKKALKGQIKNFTGIDDPYEPPKKPFITVNGNVDGFENIDKCSKEIYDYIQNNKLQS